MAVANIFSAFGLSASAGLNAYLTLLIVAGAAKLGWVQLNEPYDVMTNWWVIGVLIVLTIVEMFVDKIPAVDTINDIISTVIRPAAGAVLFASNSNVISELSPVAAIVFGLLVAGGVHVAKTTARPVVTATTAGIGNPIVSTVEDILAAVTSLLAILLPWMVMLLAVTGIVLYLRWRMRRRQKQMTATS